MKHLTAKVFRTFNSSHLFSRELSKIDTSISDEEKLNLYNKANKEVASLCNHKKKVSKHFKEQSLVISDEAKDFITKKLVEVGNIGSIRDKVEVIEKLGEIGEREQKDSDTNRYKYYNIFQNNSAYKIKHF
jgi:DNA topoisomerase-1